jgi:hypothetical protein
MLVLNLLEDNLPCAYCGGDKDNFNHDEIEAKDYHWYREDYDLTHFPEWDDQYDDTYQL